MGETMNTRYGAIDVTIQDGRTAYVRVGTGDRDDSTPADAVLELPRGIAARGRAHFRLIGDYPDGVWCWEPLRGYSLSRDGGGDLTPTAQRAADETIAAALNGIPSAQLEAAQAAKNADQMRERLGWMDALERMRDQVRAQATALELDPDARVVYLERRGRGPTESATAVRKGDGTLLFVDEPRYDGGRPPFIAHDGRGLRRYGGDDGWTESK